MSDRARDLAIVAALFTAVTTTLAVGYPHPGPATVAVSAIAASTLAAWRRRPDLVLGVTGVIAGPAIEVAATTSGLWRYTASSLAGLPLWIVPMWWIYAVTVPRLIAALSGERIDPLSTKLCAGLIAIEVAWLCAFGVSYPGVALAGTCALLGVLLYRRRSLVDVIALVVCGVIGPAAELLPVHAGAWTYVDTRLFGMPVWLPTGYGVFGVLLIHLGTSVQATTTSVYRRLARCA